MISDSRIICARLTPAMASAAASSARAIAPTIAPGGRVKPRAENSWRIWSTALLRARYSRSRAWLQMAVNAAGAMPNGSVPLITPHSHCSGLSLLAFAAASSGKKRLNQTSA
ncbi:hypothetical protein D3C78_1430420 [compost metagenome]